MRNTLGVYGPHSTFNEGIPEPWEDNPVTVGIGVLCEDGDCIVLVSDMRATYRGMHVDPHDRAGKQYSFPPFNLAACIAGSGSSAHAVVSEFSTYLRAYAAEKLKTPERVMVLEHVRDSLEYSRKKELRRLQNCEMEHELGCDLYDWQIGKLPTGIVFNEYVYRGGLKALRRVRDDFRGKVGIIVGGFLKTGPVLFRGLGFEPIEESATPPNYVIGGKGAIEANQVLIDRQQNGEMSLARTLLHLYLALKAAKISDKGVGEPAHYVVIRPWTVPAPHGMLRFNAEHPLLKQWSKTYRFRSTEPLDTSFAKDLINAALFPDKFRRSQLLGPRTLMGEL